MDRFKKFVFFFYLLCLAAPSEVIADTHNAANCTASAIKAAITAASDGDTVVIPACGTVDSPYVLEGAIIVPSTKALTITGSGNKETILQNYGSYATVYLFIGASYGSGKFPKVTNIYFKNASSAGTAVRVDGTATCQTSGCIDKFRIYNNTIYYQQIWVYGKVYGVIDHNTFKYSQSYSTIGILPEPEPTAGQGSESWQADTDISGNSFVFVENNTWDIDTHLSGSGAADGRQGAKIVFRYNTVKNLWNGMHDAEIFNSRGNRAQIVYDNTYTFTEPKITGANAPYCGSRGGTGLWYNNSIRSKSAFAEAGEPFRFKSNRSYSVSWPDPQYARSARSYRPWLEACWLTQTNTKLCYSSVGYYHTSTVCTTRADCVAAGYPDTADTGCASTRKFCIDFPILCTSTNDPGDSTSCVSQGHAGPCVDIDGNRDNYGYPCRDQIGRGKEDTTTGVQALEPYYLWNNKWCTGSSTCSPTTEVVNYIRTDSSNLVIVHDRDYYKSTGIQTSKLSPFDGSSGIGYGTLANRPDNCTTGSESGGGVGYWATDVGSNGTLYKCTAANIWTPYYTPYSYPHPLICASSPYPETPNCPPPAVAATPSSPPSIDFGRVTVGSASTAQTFTVNASPTNGYLKIGSISLTGTLASHFRIQNDSCSGQIIAPSGSCSFQAAFAPTSPIMKTANISIPSNDPVTPAFSIALSGIGTLKGDIDGNNSVELRDAILALQVMLRITQTPPVTIYNDVDVNGNGKIGQADAVYILQKIAGLR